MAKIIKNLRKALKSLALAKEAQEVMGLMEQVGKDQEAEKTVPMYTRTINNTGDIAGGDPAGEYVKFTMVSTVSVVPRSYSVVSSRSFIDFNDYYRPALSPTLVQPIEGPQSNEYKEFLRWKENQKAEAEAAKKPLERPKRLIEI